MGIKDENPEIFLYLVLYLFYGCKIFYFGLNTRDETHDDTKNIFLIGELLRQKKECRTL